MIADGNQGCFVSWYDARGIANACDIYAQRLNADATITQGRVFGGVAVCSAPGDQDHPVLASDSAGGVHAAWRDWRADGDVYAQRVRFNGALGNSVQVTGVTPSASSAFAIGAAFPNPSRASTLRVFLALPNGAHARHRGTIDREVARAANRGDRAGAEATPSRSPAAGYD